MKPRIKDSVRQVFLELLIDPTLRYISVSAIYAEGRRRIIQEDSGSENDLPSLDWLYKYVADVKRRLPEDDKWLEREWSIGSMADPSFPDDPKATRLLSQLWRRAAVGGRTLTNRTAKWAARVGVGFSEDLPHAKRLWDVWWWATEYASQEIAATMLGIPLDTGSLDRRLAFEVGDGDDLNSAWKRDEGRKLFIGMTPKAPPRLSRASIERAERLSGIAMGNWGHSYAPIIFHEVYFDVVDQLSGAEGGKDWESKLTAFEYDLGFLALRTIKDDPANRWAEMDDGQRLDLAERIGTAIQDGDHESFKEVTTAIGTQN